MKRIKRVEVGSVYWTRGKKEHVRIIAWDNKGSYTDGTSWWRENGKAACFKGRDLVWYDPALSLQGIWSGLTKAQARMVMEAKP